MQLRIGLEKRMLHDSRAVVNIEEGGGKAEVETHFQERSVELQIPPLRFAPVGMTKGRATLPWKIGLWVI